MFRKKESKEKYPSVEKDRELMIFDKTVGTSKTRLVEGDYSGFEMILISDPSNVGDVTIGKEQVVFPLLKTAYLYFRGDLDKIFAVGTDASDKVDIVLQKIRLVVKGK